MREIKNLNDATAKINLMAQQDSNNGLTASMLSPVDFCNQPIPGILSDHQADQIA